MSVTTRKKKQTETESKKVLRAQGAKRLKVFYIKQDCGCCTARVQFESEESLKAALAKLGLCNGGVLVDDAGTKHEQLDTFYGYSKDEDEARERSLGYLAEKLGRGTLGSGRKRRNQNKQERRKK